MCVVLGLYTYMPESSSGALIAKVGSSSFAVNVLYGRSI